MRSPSFYVVSFPDGRLIRFTSVTTDTCFHGPLGVHERFQPLNLSSGLAYLVLADGGQVEFLATLHHSCDDVGCTSWWSYQATAIIDPNGLRTTFTYNADGTLSRITEPAGRWLQIIYTASRISEVQAGYTIGSTTTLTQIVDYVYTTYGSYTVLGRVDYSDGTSAAYSYQNSNVSPYTGFPLIQACNDVRYPGPMKLIAYDFVPNGFYGQFSAERHWVNSTVVVSYNLATHTETRGDGKTRTFTYGATNQSGFTIPLSYFLASYTDFKTTGKAVTYLSYDANGYLNMVKDGNGNVTSFTRAAKTGNLLTLTHPPDAQGVTSTIQYFYTDQTTAYYLDHVTDELNHTTYFHPGGSTMTIPQIDYPDGGIETFTYNGFNQILTHGNRSGGTESFTYDTRGLLKSSTTPYAGQTTTYTYDVNDHLSTVKDPRGDITTLYHNQRGQLTIVQHPDASMQGWVYNDDGTLQLHNDENNHGTTFTYDQYKRLMSVTTPQRSTGDTTRRTTYFYYDEAGGPFYDYSHTDSQVRQTLLPSLKVMINLYDDNFRKISATQGAGTADAATTGFTYDDVGNLLTVTEPSYYPSGVHWTYGYDRRNRLISTDDPTGVDKNIWGNTLNISYDQAANKLSERRANNQVITYDAYDPMNRLTQQTVAQAPNPTAITKYTWYPSGSMKTMVDPGLNTYTYAYDLMNRLSSLTYPLGSTEAYTYDPAGNLATFKNRAGNVQTFQYDTRNRETRFDWDDAVTPWRSLVYDAASNVTACDNWNAAIRFTYYNDNTLHSQEEWTNAFGDNNHHTIYYAYDADGRRSRMFAPYVLDLVYDYTGRNQLSTVTNNSTGVQMIAYGYDKSGNLTNRTPNNGTSSTFVPDALNRITNITHSFVGDTRTLDYGYDVVSNRTYVQRDGGSGDGFGYDDNNQITSFQRNGTVNTANGTVTGGIPSSLAFDANGNRTTVTANGATTAYTDNALNQYSSVTGVAAPTYDANGNLATYNGWTYTYDAMNQLTGAVKGTTTAYFWRDGLGRQVARQLPGGVVRFEVFDGWDLVGEFAPGNVLSDAFAHGAGGEMVAQGIWTTPVYFYPDALGSTSHIAGNLGNLLESYTYDLYGTPTVHRPNGTVRANGTAYGITHLFTGQRWIPEIGLYDYRNRFMFPEIGRFLQTDPTGFGGGNNLYSYTGNNPANASDPSGLSSGTDPLHINGPGGNDTNQNGVLDYQPQEVTGSEVQSVENPLWHEGSSSLLGSGGVGGGNGEPSPGRDQIQVTIDKKGNMSHVTVKAPFPPNPPRLPPNPFFSQALNDIFHDLSLGPIYHNSEPSAVSPVPTPSPTLKPGALGRVTQVINDVRLLPPGAPAVPATVGMNLFRGDALATGYNSRAEFTYFNGYLYRMGSFEFFNPGTYPLGPAYTPTPTPGFGDQW